ncbi:MULTISPECIES: cell division protein CrgA [unclassified Cryobacterium]|uniref:cell division protein CrgA n=1 Tax=unclassified Cryobacterium TaxID=2649013 RepID=UPI001E39D7A2|nr:MULTISPECIES: cell division protein CrgA [unclassified Cryobacterium]
MSNTAIAPDKSTGTGRTVTGAILLVLAILGGFLGFAWIVMFYVSQGTLPIAALGSWNLLGGGFFFVTGIPMLIAGFSFLSAVPGSGAGHRQTA